MKEMNMEQEWNTGREPRSKLKKKQEKRLIYFHNSN